MPTSPSLITSLIHPDRTATVSTVEFWPDGARLFTSGFPSGIVQFWNVASRKEVCRIDTPRDRSAEYAQLTPDWKTLYVPFVKQATTRFERDGKRRIRYEYSGEIRCWDVVLGKEKDPLPAPTGSAPMTAKLGPGGSLLACVEYSSYDSTDNNPKRMTVVWDLTTRKKWKLCDGYASTSFAPNGKTIVACIHNFESRTSVVKVLEVRTGNVLAQLTSSDKERRFSMGPAAPNGAVVALYLDGKKGAPVEVWLRDAKTLEDRGKLVGKGDPEQYGRGAGLFTPDSRRFVVLDDAGNALLWDVDRQKLERTCTLGASRPVRRVAVSPDGKTLATSWQPKGGEDLARAPDVSPQDFPQPRVSLIDLVGNTPPRILVAPHGYHGGLAFSPDGKTLAFGSTGAVHLFAVQPSPVTH